MIDKKFTREGLPIVSKDTIDKFEKELAEFLRKDPKSRAEDSIRVARKIETENPILGEYIVRNAARLSSVNPQENFMLGFLIAYELLRKESSEDYN